MTSRQAAARIASVAAQYGVSPPLALAVARRESGLNPDVRPGAAGEIGLFQLLPSTAADMGVNPHSAEQNIVGGVKYLALLLRRYRGNSTLALQAYNGGMANVDRGTVSNQARTYATAVLASAGAQSPDRTLEQFASSLPAGDSPFPTIEVSLGLAAAAVLALTVL